MAFKIFHRLEVVNSPDAEAHHEIRLPPPEYIRETPVKPPGFAPTKATGGHLP
jgi:hypothetical protein